MVAEKLITQHDPIPDGKCQQCGRNDANKVHTCPYQEDINGDYRSLCNCCDDCTNECAMDI